jgi:hypothetical protein
MDETRLVDVLKRTRWEEEGVKKKDEGVKGEQIKRNGQSQLAGSRIYIQ